MGNECGGFLPSCRWRNFVCFLFLIVSINGSLAVEIRRLSVPRWIQNGTEESVVLDCEYTYNENDIRLVVKWFYEDNLEPSYQWIPELNKRYVSGVLRDRLDLNFAVNTVDAYSRFRALKLVKPTTELSGKYTCLVTSLAGQDSREQVMTVFVPESEFDLSYEELSSGLLNVTCDAKTLFPKPLMKLYLSPGSGRAPQIVTDAKTVMKRRPNSAYDVYLYRTFKISDLAKNDATVFECLLELPGTTYLKTKTVAYFPGIQRQRIGIPDEFSASGQTLYSPWVLIMSWITTATFFANEVTV